MNKNTDHISYDIKMEMLALIPNVPVPLSAICYDLGLTRLRAMRIINSINHDAATPAIIIANKKHAPATMISCHPDHFDAMREAAGAYMSEVYCND